MQINETFEEIVGQSGVKSTLSLYIDAFKETGRLPFINLTAEKGGGKSNIVRAFRHGLRRPDGTKPPILEVNSATIKNADQFFEQVYPTWVSAGAVLFLDELHCLPHKLQTVFLSVLEVKKEPVRTIEFDGVPYEFDFRNISFVGATTNQNMLLEPLQDRLRNVALEEYKTEELFEIFQNNLENLIEILPCAKEEICSSFRGNPRDAVVKAEELKTFSAAHKCKQISKQIWDSFSLTMGISPLGLNNSEIKVIKALGKKREASLTDIASMTGFDRSFIQRSLESILVRKNLLSIDGKRRLTPVGWKFYHQHCVE